MAGEPGTLELLARELALVVAPLEQRLGPGPSEALFAELGVALPGGFGAAASAIATTAVKTGELAPIVIRLTDAIEAEDAAAILTEGPALLGQIRDVLAAIEAMAAALDAVAAGAGGLTPAQRARLQAELQALPGRLLEYLVVEYLRTRRAGALSALTLAGIVDNAPVAVDPTDPTAPPFDRRAVRLDRLLNLFVDPAGYVRDTFDLGAPTFDGTKLYPRVAAFLDDRGLPFSLITPAGQPPVLEAYLLRLSADPTTVPPSLDARLRIEATQDFDRTYPLRDPWSATISAHARFDAGLEAKVRPPADISLLPPSGALSIEVDSGLQAARPGQLLLLLGQAGGSRLEVQRFAVAAGLRAAAAVGSSVVVEPSARAELAGGHLLIDLSSGDGFISAVTGGGRIDSNFDVKALWSPSTGLQFEGSAAIEIAIPTHISIGPIELQTIYLRTGLGARRLAADRAVRRRSRRCSGRSRRRSTASALIGRTSLPAGRRQPRPGRPRLRVQAAERRRPRRSTPASSRAAATSSSTPTAASTPARSSSTSRGIVCAQGDRAHHHPDARRLARASRC